jgi:hypothetical protein
VKWANKKVKIETVVTKDHHTVLVVAVQVVVLVIRYHLLTTMIQKQQQQERNRCTIHVCLFTSSNGNGSGGMYETYKKCTAAVKEWAILTWDKINMSGRKQKKKVQLKHVTVSTMMSNLQELATLNTVMPLSILHDLKIAIRLRRQASVYYNYSNQSFCEGHEWIINQLVLLYNAFRTAAYRVRKQTNNKSGTHILHFCIYTRCFDKKDILQQYLK